MDPNQQQLLLTGGGKKSTYVDDVFSTYLWEGNGTARSINNGIDLSGKGGMAWIKRRNGSSDNVTNDTVRGATNSLMTNNGNANEASTSRFISTFNSDGFSLGTDGYVNANGSPYVSYSFRKQEGFFDVVTYTGNGSSQNISHSLGSVPGMIIVKCSSQASTDWRVYHRGLGNTDALGLNTSNATTSNVAFWNNTSPTATQFTVGSSAYINNISHTYVAYVFAGGESTAAGASSIDYNGAGRTYTTSASNDFNFGTGDFTIECWVNFDVDGNKGVFQISNTSGGLTTSNTGYTLAVAHNGTRWHCYGAGGTIESIAMPVGAGQWHHVAYVRQGTTTTLYVDGTKLKSQGDNVNYNGTYITIGGYYSTSYLLNGKISNFRVVKGTAVYTDSFKPPTEPLTNISGTVLLCNNDITNNEGSTITPVALTTANGDTFNESPFDDKESYKFGEEEDQVLIKTGSYNGNANTSGPEVYVGWEPQYILFKPTTAENWFVADCMRGIVSGGNDMRLIPNLQDAEYDNFDGFSLTPTGFRITTSNAVVNPSAAKVVYMAIRRPDGYVGKPAKVGTDVFTQAYGSGSDFRFTAGFPVDFGWAKIYAGSGDWWTSARLMQLKEVKTNTGGFETAGANKVFDSNTQWHSGGADSTYISHMWKRNAGFDVVTYKGTGVLGTAIPHTMGIAPEMVWVKNRSASHNWYVGHIGLNGGVDPWHKYMDLNLTSNGGDYTVWNDTAPTATHFQVGHEAGYNGNGDEMIAFLFASVTGISKCGFYDGQVADLTITTGFSPRFLIVRNITGADNWWIFDTLRGWVAGNNSKLLQIDSTSAQSTQDFGEPTSTGFTLKGDTTRINGASNKYIYYAHA